MKTLIIKRLLLAIPTLIAVSIISFIIIQIAPGSYVDQRIAELTQQYGDTSSIAQADQLRARYGLDKPLTTQYIKWISGFVRGDFGQSFNMGTNRLYGDAVAWYLNTDIYFSYSAWNIFSNS